LWKEIHEKKSHGKVTDALSGEREGVLLVGTQAPSAGRSDNSNMNENEGAVKDAAWDTMQRSFDSQDNLLVLKATF
jgi:hypothetical protein